MACFLERDAQSVKRMFSLFQMFHSSFLILLISYLGFGDRILNLIIPVLVSVKGLTSFLE